MARTVKVELYEGGVYGQGFYTVEIPMPTKYDSTRVVNAERGRKVVIRNWGNNEYSVALFTDVDACETTDVVRGKMKDCAAQAAEFLY